MKTMQKLSCIYQQIEGEKDCHVINEFMRICFDYSHPHKVQHIWRDIESFHDGKQSKDFLQYSLLIKCLIKTNLTKEQMAERYVQVLTWTQKSNYTLTIHIALLQKLIINCGKCQSLKALRLIQTLLAKQVINAQNEDEKIKCALVTAYGLCNDIETAFSHFHSIKEKDSKVIAAMIGVLVNNNCNAEALRLYDENTFYVDAESNLLALKYCFCLFFCSFNLRMNVESN